MAKNETNWTYVLIALILVGGAIVLFGNGFDNLNIAGYGRADLREVYENYNLSKIETACKTFNGDWTQEPSFLGCENIQGTTFDCTSALMIDARTRCQSVGATYYCDSSNAYCTYGG